MSVVLHILFGLIFVNGLIIIDLSYHVQIDGDRVFTYVYALILSDFHLLVPRMSSYSLNGEPLRRIG